MQFHLFSSRYIGFLSSCGFKRTKIRNNRNIEFLDTEQRQITINKASPAEKKNRLEPNLSTPCNPKISKREKAK